MAISTRCRSPPLISVIGPIGEMRHVAKLHHVPGDLEIPLRFAADPGQMRRAAHQHDFADREGQVEREILQEAGHDPGQLAAADFPHVAALDRDLSLHRGQHAADDAQQRGLAAAVRPDQAQELAGRNVEPHVPQHGPPVVSGNDVFEPKPC